jgi:hypothetical protein
MEQQARQCDANVAEPVDEGDAVVGQDRARFRGRLVGDDEQGRAPFDFCATDELPRGRCIHAGLGLHGHGRLAVGEAQNGVSAARRSRPCLDAQSGDRAQDAEGFGLEAPDYFHDFIHIHRSGEYSISSEYKELLAALPPAARMEDVFQAAKFGAA